MSTKDDLVTALRLAHAKGEQPKAVGADLRDANLRGVNLWGADLRTAEREVPDLPTEPGAYADRDGDVVILREYGDLRLWVTSACDQLGYDDPIMCECAPFTRLVPETELAEQRKRIVDALRREGRPLAASQVARGEFQVERDEF